MPLPTTPSQTVGPYLSLGLPWPDGPHVVAPGARGAVRIHGVVLDGGGAPVADALVETWQADPDGGFGHVEHRPGTGEPASRPDGFRGFGRAETVDDGRYAITTLKPGAVPWPGDDRLQAPHIDVSVFARGLLHRLVTRIYFAGDPGNETDPLLGSVEEDRRPTLIARPDGDGGYRHDIRLQGPDETVFFAL